MQWVSSLMAAHSVAWTSLVAVQADKSASPIFARGRCDRPRVCSEEVTMTPFGITAQMPEAWARSSPCTVERARIAAAAERGVEDAGLEVGDAAPDHHDRLIATHCI
jgi:hypothetical protein